MRLDTLPLSYSLLHPSAPGRHWWQQLLWPTITAPTQTQSPARWFYWDLWFLIVSYLSLKYKFVCFCFEIHFLFQGCIKLIKFGSNRGEIKHAYCFTTILSSTTVFNIDNIIVINNNNNQMNKFLEHQISILEWFLKDHVTFKTGVKFNFAITGINYILKYINIENSSFKF